MKTEIELQQEYLNGLIELMKENPTLRVVPMVHTEVVCSDDYMCWLGRFHKAEIDYIWEDEERIYFKSSDDEDLINKRIEILECDSSLSYLTTEELEALAEKEIEQLEWEKVIVVNITTPF